MIKRALLSILRNSILVFLGLILSVAMLEFMVRAMGAKPSTYLRKFSVYDKSLGWIKTPNVEGEFIRGDRKIHEQMNSKGLRDREYTYQKETGVIRILVLGDSFTEGYDVEIDSNFTELLEKQLNDSTANRYEVINAGTGGYSTDQEYLYYQTEGYKYQPDLVVLMVYPANDIYYNIQSKYGNYSKPLFVLDGDSLKLSNVPLPMPKSSESIKSLFRDLALYPIVTRIILTNFPQLSSWLAKIGLVSKSTLEVSANRSATTRHYPRSFSIYENSYESEIQLAWQTTSHLITGLNDLVAANDANLLVCAIPDKFEVYESSWLATQKEFGVNDSIWNPLKPASLLDSITARHKIDYLDLGPSFRANSAGRVMYNGVHWNEEGNRLAASVLFNEYRKRYAK